MTSLSCHMLPLGVLNDASYSTSCWCRDWGTGTDDYPDKEMLSGVLLLFTDLPTPPAPSELFFPGVK